MEQLDGVQVAAAEQVEEQGPTPVVPPASWTGALGPAYGDGMADADGD